MAAPNNDVENTVHKVEILDHQAGNEGGPQAAYTELKSEYDHYASTHTGTDTQKYWDAVAQQLQQKNVLPDLAVAWGKENFNGFAQDGKGLNGYDLSMPFKYGTNNAQEQFDKTFASTLQDHVGDLTALQGGWHPFGIGKDDSNITTSELDKYLTNQAKNNQTAADQQTSRDQMAPLMNTYVGADGKPETLMQVLNNSNQNNVVDGYVNGSDMRRFMDDYNRFTENGALTAPKGSPYTKENAQFVQDIIDGKNPSLSKDGFGVSDMAKKGGFADIDVNSADDYNKVVAAFNKLQPQDHQATNTQPGDQATAAAQAATDASTNGGITKNGDQITQIAYPNGKTRQFGYDSSGQLNSTTYPNGDQYHKDGSGKWVDKNDNPAKFTDLNLGKDGTLSFSFPGNVKFNIAPDDSTSVTRKDASGATVTKDMKSGNILEEDGKQGAVQKFGYDKSGQLNAVTLSDGTAYTYDGTQWNDATGSKAALQGFKVDEKTGAVSYNDGKRTYNVDENGQLQGAGKAHPAQSATDGSQQPGGQKGGHKGSDAHAQAGRADVDPGTVAALDSFKNLPDEAQSQIRQQVLDNIVQSSTANPGEGLIAISARLLGTDRSDPKTEKLFQEIAQANNMQPPYTVGRGHQVLTADTLMQIARQNPDLQKVMTAAMVKQTQQYINDNPGSDGSNLA